VPQNCAINGIGYQWSNVSTTSSQFWLARRGRVEVYRIWHLSLVTTCHLIHWDRQTNGCLAVLTHLSSWVTRHFLLVHQRSGMTCLSTVILQLVWIVLNVIFNTNSFPPHMLITPNNSCLSRLRFCFFWLRLIGALQTGFVFVFVVRCSWLDETNYKQGRPCSSLAGDRTHCWQTTICSTVSMS